MLRRLLVVVCLGACWTFSASGLTQEKPAATASSNSANDGELGRRILKLIKNHSGDVAVALKHLQTGEHFEHRADVPQGTASLIKLPIMIEAYRQAEAGQVKLDEMIEVKAEDMVPGSGILTPHFSAGTRISLRDAIRLMIAFSDNTATNLVLDQITIAATGKTMQAWGLPETRAHSKVFRRESSIDPARSERFGLGSTTAQNMVELLTKLHEGTAGSPAACKAMLGHLAACDDKIKFPALLPKGTKLAHKTGSVAKIRTAAGIIETPAGPVALCVLTENNQDTRWTDDNAADRLCAEIALATYEVFAQQAPALKPAVDKPSSNLANGASGQLVEALQRTLNARSQPSPGLSVDGDFGPGTESAVKAFQRSKQLEPSGVVDRATWDALGPLLMESEPVADPGIVNSQKLPKKPADDPSSTPQVTCKAWAIANAQTGQILWNQQGEQPLDNASTTKIMTAMLVLQFCQQHPQTLEELVEFSEKADATVGSTAGLRAGEQVKVVDLLYGLLLPSGNDASVALAEHFGDRLGTDSDRELPAYDRFIAAMNRAAADLGMQQTRYANPHGLTAPNHHSSCADLVKLTVAARRIPEFQQIVACRQYGCRVSSSGGYQRNVKWENTNQLLPIEGYTGVKTGTTDAAGACLVAAGTLGNRELIVVVLGAATPAARYVDARNLFAWAWRQP